ncbi:hypothetical protein D1831_08170 [Lactiplantibacillus garii]|uniref:Uncharacterized protein n=1 Tax=Lactiplantibacillus garii TaxID=2306423 RepID=A0A426D6P7_9LACO|nr:hypothetical protein [Lactiplantibacillus garii]RRK10284.1 hypothetical protein D1831_08170 [Lactiplantibacillus garii]
MTIKDLKGVNLETNEVETISSNTLITGVKSTVDGLTGIKVHHGVMEYDNEFYYIKTTDLNECLELNNDDWKALTHVYEMGGIKVLTL